MKEILKAGTSLGVAAVIVMLAVRFTLAGLFEGLTTTKIADVMTFTLFSFVFGALIIIGFAALMWRTRQSAVPKQRDDYPVIDADYRTVQQLPGYRPPVAQLPPPQRIRVPVYSAMGKSQPLGATTYTPNTETVLESVAQDSEGRTVMLEANYRYLLRFASLKGPSRTEWSGKPKAFYACQKFFNAHGFLKPEGQTLVWKDEYPVESRKSWCYQFEPDADADADARVVHSPTPTDEGTAGESL